MKKDELPQDNSALGKVTREICYVTDTNGNYTTSLSKGWEVKVAALDITWQDIAQKVAIAKNKVVAGEVSPLHFWMIYSMMELAMVAAYTGFWQWQIKRHLKPKVFEKLSEKKLKQYAIAFNTTMANFKTMTTDD